MSSQRVLVVDTHSEITRLVELVLGRAGCQTVAVEDGCEAVALMGRERFDVVVLDALVPFQGRFVFEHLAEHHPDLVPRTVIVTTSLGNQSLMERLRAIGPCVILAKPFDIYELREAVSRTCASPLSDPEPHEIESRRRDRCGA